jgi:aminoglycoside phosphotransferase
MSDQTIDSAISETGDLLPATLTPRELSIEDGSSLLSKFDKLEARQDRLASKEMLEAAIKNSETNFGALKSSLNDTKDLLIVRIDAVEQNLIVTKDLLRGEIQCVAQRIGFLETKFDDKFVSIETRFVSLEKKFDDKFVSMENKVDEKFASIKSDIRWSVGIMAALLIAM